MKILVKYNNESSFNIGLKRLIRTTTILFCLLLTHTLAVAKEGANIVVENQQTKHKVTGIIKDVEGDPLTGISIKEKNVLNGTISDINGQFKIEVASSNAILEFTFIGMKAEEIKLQGQTELIVTMHDDIQVLKEVVVVGYGTQSKVSITGAVSAIGADEIRKTPTASFGNALQGRITGLTVTQADGGFIGADDVTMYLRGRATLNNSSPLILIDGVPRDNIRTLDVSEVESVSVLKDASATAVFGVRGANGVIIITTKRGEKGKAELSASYTQTFTAFTRKPDRLSSIEYIDMRNQAYLNSGGAIGGLPYSTKIRDSFLNPYAGLDPDASDYNHQRNIRDYLYPNHYYHGEFFKDWQPESRANVNLRGGTENVLYYMNVGYLHQGGHLNTESKSKLGYDPSLKLDRWSFRANMDYKPSKFLTARLNVGTYIEKQNTPNASQFPNGVNEMIIGAMQEVMRLNPTVLGPTTGGLGFFPEVMPDMVVKPRTGDNSVAKLFNRAGYNRNTRINLNTSFELELDLSQFVTKGLSMKGLIAYDSFPRTTVVGQRTERDYFADPDYENNRVMFSENTTYDSPMSLTRSSVSHYAINAQASLNYNRTFGVHALGGLILVQRDHWEKQVAAIPYNLISLAGRATYSYDSKYFAEFNIGYNGSEQFAPNNRYGVFPAASLGWVLTNEKFIPTNNILPFLKLRGSYGRVGNDKLGNDRFIYQDNLQLGGKGQGVGGLGEGQGVSLTLQGNNKVQWEVSDKLNIGFDFQILKDITGAFDFYKDKTSKMLLRRERIPLFQGIPQGAISRSNIGEAENRGFEFELAYNKQITKYLHIRLKGNVGTNKNKVTYADEAMFDESYTHQYRVTGHSISQRWGYLINWDSPGGGYWTSQEEIDNSGLDYTIGKPRPGDLVYIDLNKDGQISGKDYAPIGTSATPGITYGFGLDAKYKGFDFSIFFTGVGDYSTIWNGLGINEIEGAGTYYKYHKSAWTEDRFLNGDKITYPALSMSSNSNHVANEFFLQNRSFLRLRSLEIGYVLPENLLKGIGITHLRVYLTGHNLFVWDKLRFNQHDPEKDNPRGYPIQKALGFGLNVSF